MMTADPLYLFGVTVADSDELQNAFRECENVADMMAVIHYEGIDLSLEQLRKFASRHEEPWWPWSGRSSAWKEEFFRRSPGGHGPFALLTPLIDLLGMALPRREGSPRRGLA